MSFNFDVTEYSTLVRVPGSDVPARVTLSQHLVFVWHLSVVHCGQESLRLTLCGDDDTVREDAAKELEFLSYTPN